MRGNDKVLKSNVSMLNGIPIDECKNECFPLYLHVPYSFAALNTINLVAK